MTQPRFVPIAEADEVRPARALSVPDPWSPTRPSELRLPVEEPAASTGDPGPDQGFAIGLARRFADRLELAAGEELEDVLVGCALVACRRAARFGRAPSTPDLRWAFELFGFLGGAPDALVAARRTAFRSVSHDYWLQRNLVDQVPDAALSAAVETIRAERDDWSGLSGLAPAS